MREINTHIDVAASPERVWEVLTDFAHYGEWNPFFVAARGKPELGKKLILHTKYSARMRPAVSKVTVFISDAPWVLEWGGGLIVPGIADGAHGFELSADRGVTYVRHYSRFSGLIIPLAGRLVSILERHCNEVNSALKERAERSTWAPCGDAGGL
jgi:hypothetical protein